MQGTLLQAENAATDPGGDAVLGAAYIYQASGVGDMPSYEKMASRSITPAKGHILPA